MIRALIFDVDGTLAETEEAHREAFNAAFAEAGLPWFWTVEDYRRLLTTTGGKERIFRHVRETEPGRASYLAGHQDPFVARLHARKTEIYTAAVARGGAPLRPGIAALVAGARERGLKLAIATTTSRPNVDALLAAHPDALPAHWFQAMACGDEVAAKKPAPDVYLLALERLGLAAEETVAVEDSENGVRSARAAGIAVAAIPSLYSRDDDFSAADWRLESADRLLPIVLAA